MVDIPASLLGERQRHFYATEIQAIAGSAEIALKVQMGEVPAVINWGTARKLNYASLAFEAVRLRIFSWVAA
jgi:hypothetical protein